MKSTSAPRITFIGAGSQKFVRDLVRDLFLYPEMRGAEIRLMDIDAERLDLAERMVRKLGEAMGFSPSVSSFTDRRAAVESADFVFVTVLVGGQESQKSDLEILTRHGLLPVVGDTVGAGAAFRLVRTYPVLAGLAKDVIEVAPDAWVFNYANPLALNTWALLRSGLSRVMGFCHSVSNYPKGVLRWFGLEADPADVRVTAGGINHVNFYLTMTCQGRDLYEVFRERREEFYGSTSKDYRRVPYEIFEHFGYYPCEGGYMQAEYYPWFNKNRQEAERLGVEVWWGYNMDAADREKHQQELKDQIAGKIPFDLEKGIEFGADVVHSMMTHTPRQIYGNIPNHGLIDNLPAGCIVEVPVLVDGTGIRPCRVGPLPPQLAGLMMPHVMFQTCAMEAVENTDRTLLRQAIQLSPQEGAMLNLPQISAMVEEYMAANQRWMEDWPT